MAFPSTASEMNTLIGYGTTWSHGFLCNEGNSTDLQPAFGNDAFLFFGADNTFTTKGATDSDKAIAFFETNDVRYEMENPDAFSPGATEDLLVALVVKLGDQVFSGRIISHGENADPHWFISYDGTDVSFQVHDSVDQAGGSIAVNASSTTFAIGHWLVILGALQRSTNTARFCVAFDSGTGPQALYVGATGNAAAVGALTTLQSLVIGAGPEGPTANMHLSAVYLGSGVGVAGTIADGSAPANIQLAALALWGEATTGSSGGDAPTVTVVSNPTENNDPVVLHVSDDIGLSKYMLTCQDYEDSPCYVVYDSGTGFKHPFSGKSTVTGSGTVGDPYVFIIYKRGRWPTGITPSFRAIVIDSGGQVTTQTLNIDVEP